MEDFFKDCSNILKKERIFLFFHILKNVAIRK